MAAPTSTASGTPPGNATGMPMHTPGPVAAEETPPWRRGDEPLPAAAVNPDPPATNSVGAAVATAAPNPPGAAAAPMPTPPVPVVVVEADNAEPAASSARPTPATVAVDKAIDLRVCKICSKQTYAGRGQCYNKRCEP